MPAATSASQPGAVPVISASVAAPRPDSFQLLLNEYSKLKTIDLNELKTKELIRRIRNFSSRINGSRSLVFKNTKYFIFVANLDSDEIRMHLYNADNKNLRSLGAVKKSLQSKNRIPLMITNAGMYTREERPVGYYKEEGSKTFFPLDTFKNIPNANFYLMPNGVFYINSLKLPCIKTTEEFMQLSTEEKDKIKIGTQSGPMLVIHGNIHPAFMPLSKNTKLRSGLGLIHGNNKKVVFAITEGESNFYNFALIFRDIFNSDNALFLDGTISEMYLHDLNPHETGGSFGPMISVSR